MFDERSEQTRIERAIARALKEQPISRRLFLRRTGLVTASALSLPAILAACQAAPAASGGAATIRWANWPAYIDIDEETGGYPTIEAFQEATGHEVTYTEAVNDNEEFFGTINPALDAGQSTGWDLITVGGWLIERMVRLGYLQELDHAKLPNFAANGAELYKNSWYDAGNTHSVVWQAGITGIGYDRDQTGRDITSFEDLLDPEFAGRVGMFSEMRDTLELAILSLGVNPADATTADATQAQQKLLEAAERGQFRNFYGNEYYDELAAGNLALSIAWSGDITQMQLYDNPGDVQFVIPEEGGLRWTDNLAIPNGAANVDAVHQLINYWYDPAAATPLSEYIGYFTPVAGIAELIQADADEAREAGDVETADALDAVAATVNPTEEQIANTHEDAPLDEAQEAEWNALFLEVMAG
ncbi:MAG TPA: spermidine/putrescine ABC transporter substrate-binding protein [Candidatus Dormibacteraeota bacterium]|nr:spermidine/putrescine ABC transporter substrate-binding protein [Candidatus Dormibacteraeota bacterium]